MSLGMRLHWLPLLVACSSNSTQPKPIIEIKELTIRFENMPIARLHADGRSESVGNENPKDAKFSPGPTFHADGTIDLTKAGFKARVEPDGDIFVLEPGQPEHLYGRLLGDQIANAGPNDSGVRLEGAKLVLFYDSRPTNILGVVDPPSMGRTALLMSAAFYIELAIAAR